MAVDLTAVILTYNEARNLPACLDSLAGLAREIVVVDSGSTDETLSVASARGARTYHHPFEGFPCQWNWILAKIPVRTAWVLALDADYRVSPALRILIEGALAAAPTEISGYYVDRRLIFRGRWLRWGGCTQRMLKLFRAGHVWCHDQEAPDIRFVARGATGHLRAPLIEDNRNEADLRVWYEKQRRYAAILARSEWRWRTSSRTWPIKPSLRGTPDQRVLWRKELWYGMPRFVRPLLYFGYRYVVLRGFLDGWQGFLYHSVQGFWLRWLVDIELGRVQRAGPA